MASLTFVIRSNDLNGRLRVSLMAEDGVVRSEVQRRARRVKDRAQNLLAQRSSHPSGELGGSIRYTTAEALGPDSVVAQVGSDLYYAAWVEEGTGVFGPLHSEIRARGGDVLVFQSETLGRKIVTPSVRGQPGKHYLRDALEAAHEF